MKRCANRSRLHDVVIPVYDEADNVIEMHEHVGDFKEPWRLPFAVLGIIDHLRCRFARF